VHYNIILALGQIRDQSSVVYLLEFLKNPGPPGESIVRGTAAETIDKITGMKFEGDIEKIEEWIGKKRQPGGTSE
jgi:hypothetical protein